MISFFATVYRLNKDCHIFTRSTIYTWNQWYILFVCCATAVGCSNLIPPEDAWIKREDDKIIIGCYTSRQTWQLRCHDGRWTGVVSNCSQGELRLFSYRLRH